MKMRRKIEMKNTRRIGFFIGTSIIIIIAVEWYTHTHTAHIGVIVSQLGRRSIPNHTIMTKMPIVFLSTNTRLEMCDAGMSNGGIYCTIYRVFRTISKQRCTVSILNFCHRSAIGFLFYCPVRM